MRTRLIVIAAVLLAAVCVSTAGIEIYRGDINLHGKPMELGGRPQWNVGAKVGNTGTARFYTYVGESAFDPTPYTVTFHAGPTVHDSGTIEIAASTTTSTYVEFTFTTNNLAYPFGTPDEPWYSAIKFVSGSVQVSSPEGLISCSGAPEIDGGSVSFTYNRDCSLWRYSNATNRAVLVAGNNVTIDRTNSFGSGYIDVDVSSVTGQVTDAEMAAADLVVSNALDAKVLLTSNAFVTADTFLQAQITSNDSEIAFNQAQITSNDADVVFLQAQVTSNDSEIAVMDTGRVTVIDFQLSNTAHRAALSVATNAVYVLATNAAAGYTDSATNSVYVLATNAAADYTEAATNAVYILSTNAAAGYTDSATNSVYVLSTNAAAGYTDSATNSVYTLSTNAAAGYTDAQAVLKTNVHAGDVSGVWTNLQLGAGVVSLTEVNTASLDTRYQTTATATSRFDEVWVNVVTDLDSDIGGYSGVYTGQAATTVSYTQSVAAIDGRQYYAGFYKIGSAGTATLSYASQTLSGTAVGDAATYFSGDGTGNFVLSLAGEALSFCNASNVYVREITNGMAYVAHTLDVGRTIMLSGTSVIDRIEAELAASGTTWRAEWQADDVANSNATLAVVDGRGYLTSYTETDPVAATSVWDHAQYPLALTNAAAFDAAGTAAGLVDDLSGVTDAATARTNLGLVIGTDVLAPTGDGSGLSGVVTSEADTLQTVADRGASSTTRLTVQGIDLSGNLRDGAEKLVLAVGSNTLHDADGNIVISLNGQQLYNNGEMVASWDDGNFRWMGSSPILSSNGFDVIGGGISQGYYINTTQVLGKVGGAFMATNITLGADTAADIPAGYTGAQTSTGWVDIGSLLGGAADGGATNITAGASDSYNSGTRTLTWNTNAAAGGGSQTPWTADINAAGFALTNLGYTAMSTSLAPVSASTKWTISPTAGRLYFISPDGSTTNFME